jgi:invasion protein IalB
MSTETRIPIRHAPLLLCALLAIAPCAALAQTPPRAAAQPPARGAAPAPQPDRTTAQYGDWTLRCQATGTAEERVCDVLLTIADQRRQPLAQLVVRRGQQPSALAVSAQVGANLVVTEPARLMIEETALATLPFQRCLPQGCFAEAQQPEAEFTAAAGRAELARLEYRSGEGAPVVLQFPLRGLVAALQALRAAERR